MGACTRNMWSDPAEIKPAQCCIKLVFSFDLYYDARKHKIKKKITIVKTCGENARRKICEENVYEIQEGKSSIGKPRKKWLDDVENDLKKVCLRAWRSIARDKDTRNLIVKEARDLKGP